MSYLPQIVFTDLSIEDQAAILVSLEGKSPEELRVIILQQATQIANYQSMIGRLTKAIAQADLAQFQSSSPALADLRQEAEGLEAQNEALMRVNAALGYDLDRKNEANQILTDEVARLRLLLQQSQRSEETP